MSQENKDLSRPQRNAASCEDGPCQQAQALADRAMKSRQTLRSDLEKILSETETLFPDIVNKAVTTFAGRADAVDWLTWPNPTLNRETPLALLAKGQRQAVIQALARLDPEMF